MQSDHLEVTCDAHDCDKNIKLGGVGQCAGYNIHIRTTRGFHACSNYKRKSPAMKAGKVRVWKNDSTNVALTPEQFNDEADDIFNRIWYGRPS